MPEYDSSLTIHFILLHSGEYKATLEVKDTAVMPLEYTGKVKNFESPELLFRDLEKVHEMLSHERGLDIHPYHAVKALLHLHEVGIIIWARLIGEEMLRAIWQLINWEQRPIKPIISIEVLTPPEFVVPIEILPLHCFLASEDPVLKPLMLDKKSVDDFLSKVGKPKLKEIVQKLAFRLAGYASEIRYLFIQKNLPSDDPISFKSFIPLLFLWYEGGPMFKEAKEFIFSLNKTTVVKPDGPFPNNKEYNTPQSLAKLLIEQGDSSTRENIRKSNGMPTGIVHVHTHGEVYLEDKIDVTLTNAYKLIFCYKDPRPIHKRILNPNEVEVKVSNRDLTLARNHLVIATKTGEETFDKHGPFIFMNACRSNARSYIGGFNCPEDFLAMYGYRAVIGPTVKVPGPVAEYIARWFYTFLLKKDADITLALALLKAKRKLLKDHNNPLGVLYTIFGQSLLKIQWTD